MTWEVNETMRLLKNQPGTLYQEASEDKRAEIRNWIKDLLQTNLVMVEFVKADGTTREMKCTLLSDLLPAAVPTGPVDGIVKESKQRRAPDQESCRVFDTEKQQWRSFRFDRIKKIHSTISFE